MTWTASALYDDPSPLSALVGTWSGNFADTGGDDPNPFTIAADGSFTEQDSNVLTGQPDNCIIAGQFSTDDPTHNLYSVTWIYNGGSDCINGATNASGLAYIDFSVDPVVLHIAAQVSTVSLTGPTATGSLTDLSSNTWTLSAGLIYQNSTLVPSGNVILLKHAPLGRRSIFA